MTFRRYTEAYRDRAYARVLLGRYDLAMADADKAVELAPGRADVLNSRCWLRAMAARDLPGALADCDAALAQEPEEPAFLHSRAYAHLQAGSLAAAEADLKRAAVLRPDDPDVLFLAGIVKLRQGDEAGARADIARARAKSPIVHRDYIGLDLPAWATGAG